MTTIDDLAQLRDGWDSYGGRAPTPEARATLIALMVGQPVPLSDGGLQIEVGDDCVVIGPGGRITIERSDEP